MDQLGAEEVSTPVSWGPGLGCCLHPLAAVPVGPATSRIKLEHQ